MTSLRSHLTYANVVATLALVVAIAGGSTAIAVSSKLKKNSVGTKQLKNRSVTAAKLADGAVIASKLAPVHSVSEKAPVDLVRCPSGERLLSGGALAAGGSLTGSYPSDNAVQWAFSGTGTLEGYAVCLRATPGG
jgi:hypothetical protein